jgi:hypothetical protein
MSETRYRLVLVPADQVVDEHRADGLVMLAGTPGEGIWDEWGPYPDMGEVTVPGDPDTPWRISVFGAALHRAVTSAGEGDRG